MGVATTHGITVETSPLFVPEKSSLRSDPPSYFWAYQIRMHMPADCSARSSQVGDTHTHTRTHLAPRSPRLLVCVVVLTAQVEALGDHERRRASAGGARAGRDRAVPRHGARRLLRVRELLPSACPARHHEGQLHHGTHNLPGILEGTTKLVVSKMALGWERTACRSTSTRTRSSRWWCPSSSSSSLPARAPRRADNVCVCVFILPY